MNLHLAEDGTVDNTATLTDLVVAGIKEGLRVEAHGAGPPGVKRGGAARYLE